MGIQGLNEFDRVILKMDAVVADFRADLQEAGEAAAEGVVRTTLAGIGDGDQPFQKYSAAYQKRIDAVGGKAQSVVTMRGLFYHANQARKRYRSNASRTRERADRSAGRSIHSTASVPISQVTRPSLGIEDERSEMSVDLLAVSSTDTQAEIKYTPRQESYMLAHQNGEGHQPRRPWFSLNKAPVKAAILTVLERCLEIRARIFNS